MELAGLDPARMTLRLVEPTRENGHDAARDLLAGGTRLSALVVGHCLLIIVTAIMQTFRNKYRLRDVLSINCRSRDLSRAGCRRESDGVGSRLPCNQCFE
jgi:hypothetical protein